MLIMVSGKKGETWIGGHRGAVTPNVAYLGVDCIFARQKCTSGLFTPLSFPECNCQLREVTKDPAGFTPGTEMAVEPCTPHAAVPALPAVGQPRGSGRGPRGRAGLCCPAMWPYEMQEASGMSWEPPGWPRSPFICRDCPRHPKPSLLGYKGHGCLQIQQDTAPLWSHPCWPAKPGPLALKWAPKAPSPKA